MFRKRLLAQVLSCCMLLLLGTALCAAAAGPDKAIVKAARKEGNLYIYGSPDADTARLLVKEFETLYPGIKVDFLTMPSAEVFNRHMGDLASQRVSADILWNSDINLQAPLVRDGYALPYRPVPVNTVMPQAYLGDAAFVTGFEPVVLVYNRRLVSARELPSTRALLLKMFEKPEWRGKIATVDPEKSALAFLLLTQDMAYGGSFWKMVARLGDAGLKLCPDYPALLERVSSGEIMAGYNLPLSEVLKRAGTDENIGWLYTSDYTLLIPQTVLITRVATNPNAARLWIDFVLSAKAQQIIAENSNLFPVDTAVAGGEMKKLGREIPPGPALRMIGTGPEVTNFGAGGLRSGFLLRWKQKLKLVK